MKQIDKIRSMTIEEVARGRLIFVEGGFEHYDQCVGDFGSVTVKCGNHNRAEKESAAYAEALRLEIAWLESEAEGEK